ncbi:alpha/beta fold hydrolase [Deinococcus hohokamensis]|uniref:Alpha/beta fold hydrolase n=1 Tax=Deinococcus hohokamensis TaxID=309883 RepID=A0ABV9I415_9DEIO
MWTEHDVLAGGLRMHYVAAGPEQGPLVVLLHGFPEFWRAWEYQLGPLARAGFRVVAPDLRGYNLTEKPPEVHAYRVETLQNDVAALIRALGRERAQVVGHDWGGIVAWQLAIRQPGMVERLVILNAPHPAVSRRVMKDPAQQRRSWYIFFFQLPWLPERLLPAFGNWALRGTRPGSYTEEDRAHYRRAWAQPGAASGMINYYRALLRHGTRHGLNRHDPHNETVKAPTLIIWGDKDVALLPEMAEAQPWVPDLRLVHLPRASHWVMRDEPVKVNNLLIDFLQG